VAIVTISRMFGSGGSEIAERVALALGWELLYNAVVDAVAQRLGAVRADVAAREERVPSLVERLARAMALSSQEWLAPVSDAPMAPSEDRLAEMTRRVVEEAVARGPVVVVGRGAQSMLAAREDALHVFCYAERSALIRRTMEREDIAEAQAAKLVEESNRQREEWVRKHWSRAWRAHENYHLSLDTAWFGVEGAAELIVKLARERLGGVNPRSE
jgi:cytidylate kinase